MGVFRTPQKPTTLKRVFGFWTGSAVEDDSATLNSLKLGTLNSAAYKPKNTTTSLQP